MAAVQNAWLANSTSVERLEFHLRTPCTVAGASIPTLKSGNVRLMKAVLPLLALFHMAHKTIMRQVRDYTLGNSSPENRRVYKTSPHG